MAITSTGSVVTVSGNGVYNGASGTIASITVPADATLMTIGVSAYSATTGRISANGTFDIGGNTSVGVGGAASASFWQAALHYILNPATGTQNLDWQWGGGAGAALDDAVVIISYCFWKGVDTGSPVRDSDGDQSSGDNTTTPTLTALTGDKIIAWVSSFEAVQNEKTFVWTGATSFADVPFSSYADGGWATADPTGNQTVNAQTSGRDEGGICAFVFKAAAAAGTDQLEPWQRHGGMGVMIAS